MNTERNIVIIGRPNVGKSSLLNALLGYRRAIVWDEPGTTLDIVTEKTTWDKRTFMLTDSQGIYSEHDTKVLEDLLKLGDAYIFVVDAIAGPTPFDRWIAKLVLQARKPVLLCVNKIETKESHSETDFAELGFDDVLSISAAHRFNLATVKTWVVNTLVNDLGVEAAANDPLTESVFAEGPEVLGKRSKRAKKKAEQGEDTSTGALIRADRPASVARRMAITEGDAPLTIAFIGRPNTGKSTLMNRLCGSAVSRVSPLPLTTRDPVSHEIQTEQGWVHLIDTAGMRRPRSDKTDIEVYSIQASTRALRQADVVFLLIGCNEGVTDQDVRLLNLIVEEGRPTAVLLNFWDTLGSHERKVFVEGTDFKAYLETFHLVPLSGLTGFNVNQILPLAFRMYKSAQKRVKTSRLNEVVSAIVAHNPPPNAGRQNFNILYASQVRVDPPTFVFFLNRENNIPDHYRTYMEKQLRTKLGFKGQSIRVLFRGTKTRAKPGWVKDRDKFNG